MGMMMILVSQLEGLDGATQVEPTSHGIVIEVDNASALDEWVAHEEQFIKKDDPRDPEVRDELEKSNPHINFSRNDTEMYRIVRDPDWELEADV